jgi:hypothetical protein
MFKQSGTGICWLLLGENLESWALALCTTHAPSSASSAQQTLKPQSVFGWLI